jgi:hypothetical protein
MSPDKFDVKSVLGEIKKMNRRFSFSKCDLVIGIITLFLLLTLKLFLLYIAVSYCYLRTSYKIFLIFLNYARFIFLLSKIIIGWCCASICFLRR